MAYRERYNQTEGNYSKDTFIASKSKLFLICVFTFVIAIIALFFIKIYNSSNEDEGKVRNEQFYSLSVSDLEYVASNSKKKSDKEDALLILFNTYKKRSVFNLYDFYLNHKGEKYTDEALSIVIYQCDSLYDVALNTNTEQSWSNYIVSVPEDFQKDALDRYNEFKWTHTAELWDTEEKAWEQVSLQKGIGAYKRYIKMYPNGPHVIEARQTIKRYEREEKIRERNREIDRQKYKAWIDKANKARWK